MKLDKIPERLDPSLDLEQIRAECLELTKNAPIILPVLRLFQCRLWTWSLISVSCRN